MTETIDLDYPITVKGEQVSQLQISRRPKVKDMKKAQEAASSDAGQEVHLFAILTGINPEDLEELDLSDYRKLQDAYSHFLA
mgnify:CR=1 FL=1